MLGGESATIVDIVKRCLRLQLKQRNYLKLQNLHGSTRMSNFFSTAKICASDLTDTISEKHDNAAAI